MNLPSLPSALRALACGAALAALAGCVSPVPINGKYAQPIGGAPVIDNPTPYTDALACLAHYTNGNGSPPFAVAVGKLLDYTGKDDLETGKRVTQGAALMAMSALAKAGVPQVERYDTSIAEIELKYANNKLIGHHAGDGGSANDYRRILAGSLPGSTHHLIGGITEVNYNIRSSAGEVLYDFMSVSGQLFVMNVGLDLRLVNTTTLRVERIVSYQKQILGREVRAGVFRFFNNKLLDIGLGEKALEPVQLAVRAVIERAVYEIVRELYRVPASACGGYLVGPDQAMS